MQDVVQGIPGQRLYQLRLDVGCKLGSSKLAQSVGIQLCCQPALFEHIGSFGYIGINDAVP